MHHLFNKNKLLLIIILCLGIIYLMIPHFKQRYENQHNLLPSIQDNEVYERLLLGIDVSEHQGEIDWNKVADSSIDFAIIRSSYGWSDYLKQTDDFFERNYKEATLNQIPVGIYHYSYATTEEEALKEAEFVIHLLKNKHIDYPIFYDLEDECIIELESDTIEKIAITFLERLKKEGYCVGIYTNPNFLSRLSQEIVNQYDLWLANYNVKPNQDFNYTMWQYSCYGKVYGIEGDVDLNFCYYNYPSYIKDHYSK